MIKRILILFLSTSAFATFAQQEFMTTHYMFSGLALNPAYAGVHEGLSTSFLYRNQWVGFEGSPNTQVASVHSPINNRPISLGALVYRDQLGLSTEYGSYFSYAYRISITEGLQLSMGLQFNLHNFGIDYERAESGVFDIEDNLANISEFKWNTGAGFLLHSERLFVGVSMPQIMNREIGTENPNGNFSELVRHFYFLGGYAFDIGRGLVLKPNILVKSVGNAPTQVDLNANLLINSLLWIGASYRSMDSLDGIIGLQVTPQFMVSYATDFTLSEIDTQSHEVMLNYIFELPTKKIRTPRYF